MSLYDVGETAFVTFWTTDDSGVAVDADALPTATVTPLGFTAPPITPSVAHSALGTYTVAAALAVAGEYVLRVAATVGGNVRVDARRLAALDPDVGTTALPAWAPSLGDVADHIPTRTRPTTEWGSTDTYSGTFTDATTPTRAQVTRLIRRACAWVEGAVGAPVAGAAWQPAGVAAALRAAWFVELAYPERDADLAVYDRLAAAADAATLTAREVNAVAGGTVPDPGNVGEVVVYDFPTDLPPAPYIVWH